MRLKRNHYCKQNEEMLTDRWYRQTIAPKFLQIFEENEAFLQSLKDKNGEIQFSSYNPISYEINITPVVAEILKNNKYNLNHSLPVAVEKGMPLVFREYEWGDDLVKSPLFSVYEPTSDKKHVYPQVMIVPLMGFMEDCHRIGYGGGFYDRSIE